jgi:hypothetical protein
VLSAVRTKAEETTDDLNISRVKEIGYLALHEIGRPTGKISLVYELSRRKRQSQTERKK